MTSALAIKVEQLLALGVASASDLAAKLKVSQPSISRAIAELTNLNRVVRMGAARGARYGLRHDVPSAGCSWPLYRVDTDGVVAQIATLHALAADEFLVEPQSTIKLQRVGGLTHGLPHYLQDQRPGGFLGRGVPRQFPELQLPQRIAEWSDDHYLRYFTQHGGTAVSDLILGDASLNEMLAAQSKQETIRVEQREQNYVRLADIAMAGGIPGSSAHGEQPKFTAVIETSESMQHTLVKFSPPRNTPAGQRWSDLLVAEHLAHRVINQHTASTNLRACESEVLFAGDRTFLEVRRFDRRHQFGRMGVTSLFAIDAELYGQLDSWTSAAARLFTDSQIDQSTLYQLRFAAGFGAMIANTDRHFGNLAFFDDYAGPYQLAPIYDMLPMLFAPEHGQVINRIFDPPHTTADTLEVWSAARQLATTYWAILADDERISAEFRAICARCGTNLSQ